jgi:hypothetical protein
MEGSSFRTSHGPYLNEKPVNSPDLTAAAKFVYEEERATLELIQVHQLFMISHP